jgi:hypothetical protein
MCRLTLQPLRESTFCILLGLRHRVFSIFSATLASFKFDFSRRSRFPLMRQSRSHGTSAIRSRPSLPRRSEVGLFLDAPAFWLKVREIVPELGMEPFDVLQLLVAENKCGPETLIFNHTAFEQHVEFG